MHRIWVTIKVYFSQAVLHMLGEHANQTTSCWECILSRHPTSPHLPLRKPRQLATLGLGPCTGNHWTLLISPSHWCVTMQQVQCQGWIMKCCLITVQYLAFDSLRAADRQIGALFVLSTRPNYAAFQHFSDVQTQFPTCQAECIEIF